MTDPKALAREAAEAIVAELNKCTSAIRRRPLPLVDIILRLAVQPAFHAGQEAACRVVSQQLYGSVKYASHAPGDMGRLVSLEASVNATAWNLKKFAAGDMSVSLLDAGEEEKGDD